MSRLRWQIPYIKMLEHLDVIEAAVSHYSELPEVELVDEMLAILSDRNAIIQKKEAERAQAKSNELYYIGLDIE